MLIKKHLFIVNPQAGFKNIKNFEEKLHNIFKRMSNVDHETEYKVVYTEYEGHAQIIAKDYSLLDKYIIYAVGGDGTLNEVLNGMVNTNSVLGWVPVGTGNDFMKTLNPNFDENTILENTINGYIKEIDYASLNEYSFINIASIGIDATVLKHANIFKKTGKFSGKKAYFFAIIPALKEKNHKMKVKLKFNGLELEKELILLAMANGKAYGGGFSIAPEASITDGLLDIILVGNIGLFNILSVLPKLIRKKHLFDKRVEFYRTNEIIVESLENSEFHINIDGREIYDNKIHIKLHEKSLKFIYPL